MLVDFLARRGSPRPAQPPAMDLDAAMVAEALPHTVWMADSAGNGDYVNNHAAELTGIESGPSRGFDWLEAVHPQDRDQAGAAWAAAVQTGEPFLTEYRIRQPDGRYRRTQARAQAVRAASGEVLRWIGTWTDVEEERQVGDHIEAERRLAEEALALVDAIEASAPLAIGFIDTEFRLVRFNDTLARLNGLSPERHIGQTIAEALPELWPSFEPHYRAVIDHEREVTTVHTLVSEAEGRETVWYTKYFPVSAGGALAGIGIVGLDITETKQAERFRSVVLDTMAEGLYALDGHGRITFLNRSAAKLLGWTEEELRGKLAHQTFHHQHADGAPFPAEDCPLLKVQTEGRVVRSADDSFIHRDGRIIPVAYSAAPLRNESGQIDGVVIVFRDATAESAERSRARRELNALSWLGRIRDALDEDRMVLYSQPIVPLTGGQASEELLLRLVTPSGEIVQPGSFLPIAEQYGLVADIDRWVITQAIQRAASGRSVEVNISAWTIANVDVLPLIERLIRETGADPSRLTFEVTETAFMHNLDAGGNFAHALQELGCGLALDDFGTGYASFTYLKTLPFKYLKIDIEFVRDLANSAANRHVVDAIVSLAKGFGQQTIAEGVEDESTLTILKERGVDFVQGFHLGKPAPISFDD